MSVEKVLITKSNEGYISDQVWLQDVTPTDAVLCRRTALIMLGLITGNISENTISIYKGEENDPPHDYRIVVKNGVKCTTAEQTITDMLNDDEKYDSELAEGMANYYYTHHESFDGLPEIARKSRLFSYYCEWAKRFFGEG